MKPRTIGWVRRVYDLVPETEGLVGHLTDSAILLLLPSSRGAVSSTSCSYCAVFWILEGGGCFGATNSTTCRRDWGTYSVGQCKSKLIIDLRPLLNLVTALNTWSNSSVQPVRLASAKAG